MKETYAKIIFIIIDIAVIFISISLAYTLRNLSSGVFDSMDSYSLSIYIEFYPIYIITIAILFYEGIYTHRYDFWHESRVILKGLIFSLVIILAYLAITKTMQDYSRAVIILSFVIMGISIPVGKNISKKLLFMIGIWRREAKVYGDDKFLKEEIFDNHYLGYIEAEDNKPKTIFINSKGEELNNLKDIIDKNIQVGYEVIFIPLIDEYDLTRSHIYSLSNTRTNLIVFQNRLKNRYRLFIKKLSDIIMSILVFPLLLPLMLYIAYRIRKEEPNSSIFFKQDRLGEDGEVFICYKFRSMFEKSDTLLESYLASNPDEVEYYSTYHKYKSDPRITKIGNILRRTSLDELPQIFNIFKNEMSFIGPRPYMVNEKSKIGESVNSILTVKPGITGLWQVSGRSEVDFYSRVKLDVWYIRNWNLWMDLVILIKTIKTVLFRDGAS